MVDSQKPQTTDQEPSTKSQEPSTMSHKNQFSCEGLEVWQRAVAFAEQVIRQSETWQTKGKHYRLLEQIEAAVTSVPMNIAEGKGRYSKKEFTHYL